MDELEKMAELDIDIVASHGVKRSLLKVKKGTVVRDGDISPEAADKLFRAYCMRVGSTSKEEMTETKVLMAVSLCGGTSAETDLSKRFLDGDDPDTALTYLGEILTGEGSPLAGRTNYLRVFARSLPDFADLTRDVINANAWLKQERAMDYEVDVSVAGVCFDYAEKCNLDNLTPTEKTMVTYGLRKKAREGRSNVMLPEGMGVKGSDPVSRGVGSSIVPDATRVGSGGARGVGPYA